MPQLSMKTLRAELKLLMELDLGELERSGGLDEIDSSESTSPHPTGSQPWHTDLAWRLMTRGVPDGQGRLLHLEFRQRLMRVLLTKNKKNEQRRANALNMITAHCELFELDEQEPSLEDATQSEEESSLVATLRTVNMLTEPYRRLSVADLERPQVSEELLLSQLRGLRGRWFSENVSQGMIALPHGPMSTLTRESMNLGSLVRHGRSIREGIGVARSPDRRSLFVGDHRLVMKGENGNDVYMSVPLVSDDENESPDLIATLTQSLMKICEAHFPKLTQVDEQGQALLEPSVRNAKIAGIVEEIPRVVAGIFHTAKKDERIPILNSGEFMDSMTGKRLTKNVGRSESSWDSCARVCAVRSLLERVELQRTVSSEDGLSSVTWKGPIIQQLADSIDYERRLPDGIEFSKHSELKTWRIAPALWRMQDVGERAANFMLLDERAFELSVRSSSPFNIYWTIVQRANNAWNAKNLLDKFDDSGVFRPRIGVLYTWAGVENQTDRDQSKARERLRKHMQSIKDSELITWFDESSLKTSVVSIDSDSRLAIGLPPSLLKYLSPKAFRSGTNPFESQRSLAGS